MPLIDRNTSQKQRSRSSKDEQRLARRKSLLKRIDDKAVKVHKRRRPSKKLKTDLTSLAKHLDHIADELEDQPTTVESGHTGSNGQEQGLKDPSLNQTRIPMKSARHRPGVLKRRLLTNSREIDRFRRNLAQMSGEHNEQHVKNQTTSSVESQEHSKNMSDGHPPISARWAALRNFIGATMETDPAFAQVTDGKGQIG